jgi:hypothetical protein
MVLDLLTVPIMLYGFQLLRKAVSGVVRPLSCIPKEGNRWRPGFLRRE